jgi:predicted PurR-regulated permease PerM
MDPVAPRPNQPAATSETQAAQRGFALTITARSMWVAALIALVILAGIFLVATAQGPIVLFVLSIVLGEGIRPLVVRLKRYRVPGPLAVLLIYLVVFLVVGALLWVLLTPLLNEVGVFAEHLPQYLKHLQDDVHQLEESLRVHGRVSDVLDSLLQSLATLLQSAIPALLAVPFKVLSGVFSLFIDLVIVLTLALFWLTSATSLKTFVVGLCPATAREHVSDVLGEIAKGFGGYVRGVLISMFVIGAFTGLGLTLLGIPYALLLGALTGVTGLLPYIGPWISGSVAVVVTLVALDPGKALQVIALFVILQLIEGELVQPLVLSRSVRIDPLLVLMSVLIGFSALGIIGAILAVPIAASIKVILVQVLAPMLRRASDRSAQSDQIEQTSPNDVERGHVSESDSRSPDRRQT